MKDLDKTREQIVAELGEMRQRISQLEAQAAGRRGAEEALRTSEALYRSVVECQTDLICRYSPGGTITFANGAYCRYFGRTQAELVGQTLTQSVPDEESESVARHFASLRPETPVLTHEHRVISRDGRIRWQRWIDWGVFDDEGNLVEIQGVGQDITDLKKAEEEVQRLVHELRVHQIELEAQNEALRTAQMELEKLKDRYLDLYDFAPVGYVTLNDKGLILEANLTAVRLLGEEKQRLFKTPFPRFVSQDFSDAFYLYLRHVFETQVKQTCEIKLARKDGTHFYVQLESVAVHEEGGEFTRCRTVMVDITALKRQEKRRNLAEEELRRLNEGLEDQIENRTHALRESEEKYRTLFEESFDGLFITSPEGKILDMNKKGFAMFGYDTKEDILRLDLEKDVYAYPPDRRRILSMINVQGSAEYEVVVKKKNGEEMITYCSLTAGRDEKGVITSYRGIIRDITDLAQVRLRLENERVRLRTLVQTIPDLVWLKDPDGVYLTCNPRFERFFGAKESDIVGKTDYDFVDADLADFFRDHDRKAMVARKPSVNEEWITFADDGHRELLETIKTPMHDSKGRLVGVLGIARNITAARKAEGALQEANSYNCSLIEASLDPLVTINPEGKITDVNKATGLVTGYSRDELIGTDFADYFTVPQKAREGYQRAFTEGIVKDYELEIRHRDGDLTAVMYNASVYRDSSGEIVGLFAAARNITERRHAEEATLRLAAIVESSDDAIISKTLNGNIVTWNGGAASLYGYRAEEVVGQPISILVPPELFDDFQDILTKIRLGEVVRHFETMRRTKDGRILDVSLTISPVKDPAGQIVGASTIARDITERKMSEALARIRLGLLEFSVSHSLDQLLQKTLDEVGNLSNSQIGFYHFVESDQETLSLQAWSTRTAKEFCKAEGKGMHYRIDQAGVWVDCVHERKPVIHNDYSSLPHRKGMPEGHAAVVRELVVPIMRSDRIVAILGIGNKPTDYTEKDIKIVSYLAEVAWEITERKRSEEALKESEQQYRTLFEDSIDGVYSVLRDGTVTDANSSFCELFGYTREEMIGKDIRELYLDPADRPRFQKEIEEKGFVKDCEVTFQKRDGTEVDCSLTSSVYFGKDESIAGYRGILRDLTASKSLQRQLFQAQKMEAVGTLTGGVAHDFNNLLTVVTGFSELLLAEQDEQDPAYADLQKINQAGQKGADLVRRLLAFSRKSEIKPRPLNLNHQIGQLQKMLARTIPKMIEIELSLASRLSPVNADPTQMDQVLMNLAVNAKDAMPDGGRLTIETANVVLDEEYTRLHLGTKPGEYVLLSVSDTGQGMDKETLDHIFEPFYTTKEAGKGTGLGLAMVYGIVTQHGGQIRCYSESGHGTTFKIYLPASGSAAEREQLQTATRKALPRGSTETILLVDDEKFVRELGKRILERSGYTVRTAANGRKALKLYKREMRKISLVILDLIMPEMGGKQCLEELLKIDPKARVLIASGLAASGQSEEAFKTGARGFVGKPYNMKGMLQSVREVLDAD